MIFSIVWDVDPTLFELGPLEVRWYGLLYAMTFLVGLFILQAMFKRERVPHEWADAVLIYMMIGTIIGARLGHVFFYDWGYYSQHPGEILKIWHGGLASHGGAIGIITALWLFSKWVSKRNILWILDRVVAQVALGGVFIRTGNLMNSEIFGRPTNLPWGFEFVRAEQFYPLVPRHPTQIYEALLYGSIFIALIYIFRKTEKKDKPGFMLGTFMALGFGGRFLIEFVKENQSAFEADMMLNMGQWLSLPFIIAGLFFMFRKKELVKYKPPQGSQTQDPKAQKMKKAKHKKKKNNPKK